jgi:hypothetical protein
LEAALDRDAVARYERALADAANAREVWEVEGRPLTVVYPNGAEGVAPLWKLLQAAEAHASRMARELRLPGRPGRKSFLEGGLHTEPPPLRPGPAAELRRIGKAR